MISHRATLKTTLVVDRRYEVGACNVLFGASPFTLDVAVYDRDAATGEQDA